MKSQRPKLQLRLTFPRGRYFRESNGWNSVITILAEFMFGGWWNFECYHLLQFISVWPL